MVTGSAANVLFATTSLTENLKNYPTGYLVNSPAETAPLSGVSAVAPLWDYANSYTAIVSKAAFGAGTFGSVVIPGQHNSPAKVGSNLILPGPCDGEVINTAKVTAKSGNLTLTASDTANVQIAVVGSVLSANVTATTPVVSSKQVSSSLTNNGTAKAVISKIVITWPAANGKLLKVKLAGKVLFDTVTPQSGSPLTITTFKGTTGDRSIDPTKVKALLLEFEKNGAATGYVIDVTFTNGMTVHIVK